MRCNAVGVKSARYISFRGCSKSPSPPACNTRDQRRALAAGERGWGEGECIDEDLSDFSQFLELHFPPPPRPPPPPPFFFLATHSFGAGGGGGVEKTP